MATTSSSKRQLVHTSNTYQSNSDFTVGGDLFVNGATTTIDTANLLVEDKNIVIGSVSTPSDTTADGGGITLKGASDYTINWSNSTDSWHFNQGITVDSGNIDLGTDQKVRFGATDQLQIYHNGGTNGFIHNTTPYLVLESGSIIFRNTAGNEDYAKFIGDSGCELYYNNGHRLSTTTDGIQLYGNGYIDLPDNGRARFGGGFDLAIYHNSTNNNNYIQSSNGRNLFIESNGISLRSQAGENMITATGDGAVNLYHNNALKLSTTSAGASFSGGLYISGNYTDAGNQLNIWCDTNGHGNVAVYDFTLKTGSNNSRTNTFKIDNNGKVGIGTASPDTPLEIEVPSAANTQTRCFHIDHNPTSNTGSGYLTIRSGTNAASSASLEQVSSGGGSFYGTYSDTNLINHGTQTSGAYNNINFVTNGAIRMTVGGGSQAGNVGIGTTSPSEKLTVNGHIRVGNGTNIYLWNDNNNNYLNYANWVASTGSQLTVQNNGTGGIHLKANGANSDVIFSAKDGTTLNELMRLDGSTGNVGIGYASPSYPLHVRKSVNGNFVARIGNTESTSGSNYGLIVDGGSTSVDSAFEVRSYAGSNYFKVRGDGNVGIGTTSPATSLQVSTTDAANILTLHRDGSNNGTNTTLNRIQFAQDYDAAQQSWGKIDLDSNASSLRTDLKFYVKSTGGSQLLGMTVHGTISDGPRVGIGTSSPAQKLDVHGIAKIGTSATNGHLIGRKDYSVTQTFSTGLTVTLGNHQACHVKIFISGDWSNHSSIAYVGEFFIQNADNNSSTFNEPGLIISEHDNLKLDGILSKIVDGTSDAFEIQFRANTNSATSVSARLCYHVMGDASAVS